MSVDFSKLRKLATAEDAHHIHKALGAACLLHFAYRAWDGVNHQSFPRPGEPPLVTVLLMGMHMALSASSLQFHLPQNRVRAAPMMWPEFRAHSILFALRHLLLCCVLLVASCGGSEHASRITYAIRGGLVLGTLAVADGITELYRPLDNKHGTTMRGMPLPPTLAPILKTFLNAYYSLSQALATLTILHERPGDLLGAAFWPVFPIQLAAFLMTLVRKGLLTTAGWHIAYSAALLWNYVHGLLQPGSLPRMYWVGLAAFAGLRLGLHLNKYLVWVLIIAVSVPVPVPVW